MCITSLERAEGERGHLLERAGGERGHLLERAEGERGHLSEYNKSLNQIKKKINYLRDTRKYIYYI